MKKFKIITTPRSFASVNSEPIRFLEESGCTVLRLTEDKGSIEEQLKKEIVEADGVIAGLDDYSEELISKAKNLKVISRYGVGYDKVDLSAAKDKNIAVTITPGANDESVADLAVALMLASARHISFSDRSLRNKKENRPMGIDMWGKTLGVLGTGRIGKGVIKRAKGFNMKVLCYDLYQDEDLLKEDGVSYTSLKTLLEESDFITVHTPLNDETKDMISTKEFAMMKNHAILVNTARGGIINEEALYQALKDGDIGGAAMDAMVFEPPYNSPLLTLNNFTATSHLGATTYDAIQNMSMMAAQNIVDILKKGRSEFTVN